MNMLKTIARKVSPCLSALKLDLVDATKEWCALQDRGGAYGLKVVNKGVDNGEFADCDFMDGADAYGTRGRCVRCGVSDD